VIEILFLCERRAGLSHAEYAAHLLERHAPLALAHHASLRGYALYVVDEPLDGTPPLDSVNALAFESLADFETRLYDSPEGERLVTDDHARFFGGAAGYAGRLRVHQDGETHWICALRRRERLEPERFHDALASAFVPDLLASQPAAARVAVLRVERKLFPADAPDWDAFLQLGFAGPRAPLHPFDSPDCAVTLRRRIAALCEATAVWRVSEHVKRRASEYAARHG